MADLVSLEVVDMVDDDHVSVREQIDDAMAERSGSAGEHDDTHGSFTETTHQPNHTDRPRRPTVRRRRRTVDDRNP
jgi:hypothetical protein